MGDLIEARSDAPSLFSHHNPKPDMHMNTIATTALTVAALSGAAFAGTKTVVAAPQPIAPAPVTATAECPVTGKVAVGYATNYTYRGLVASHAAIEGDSIIPVSAEAAYALNKSDSILAALSYDSIVSGHSAFGYDNYDFKNEFNFTLAYEKKLCPIVKGLSVTGGYNFTHGGLEGFLAKYAEKNGTGHSYTHELFVNVNQKFGNGIYTGITVNYSFAGVTGWWYQPYVGFEKALCDAATLDVKAGWTLTSSYFDNKMDPWANGTQAVFIKTSIDAKVTDNLSVVPFVSFNWAGNGALKANSTVAGEAVRNFGVVAGASLVYKF